MNNQTNAKKIDFSVENAKEVIQNIGAKSITTNQIRKILAIVNKISNEAYVSDNEEEISNNVESLLYDLKIKIAYQSGREDKVKLFCKRARLNEGIDKILKTRSMIDLNEFLKYVEALVAYHKYYGGK